MAKHFYTHLFEIESLYIELERLDLSEKEKIHLAELIDSNLHNTVLEVVLSELNDKDKHIFLTYLSKNDHDKLWDHLNERVDKIEEKIKKAASDLKAELHQDLNEAHRIKKGKK